MAVRFYRRNCFDLPAKVLPTEILGKLEKRIANREPLGTLHCCHAAGCFMSLDKAPEIVKQAMTDRSVYDAMAACENEVWGTSLPALEDSHDKLEYATATASQLSA
jgi:hypothetical protein